MIVNILNNQIELPLTVKYIFNNDQQIAVDISTRQPLQNIMTAHRLSQFCQNDYVKIIAELQKIDKNNKYNKKQIVLSGIEVYPLDYKIKTIYTVTGNKYYSLTKTMNGAPVGGVEQYINGN